MRRRKRACRTGAVRLYDQKPRVGGYVTVEALFWRWKNFHRYHQMASTRGREPLHTAGTRAAHISPLFSSDLISHCFILLLFFNELQSENEESKCPVLQTFSRWSYIRE